MKKVLNDCEIYYEVHGDTSSKNAIFFIHGGPGLGDCRGDIATYSDFANDYQKVFLDMRGSGRSADVPPFTHDQWVEDIDALRKELGLDKIILHGSSYGGFIIQEYALKFPENTQAIALNVTAPDNEHHFAAIENAKNSDKTKIDANELTRLFEGKVESNEDFKYLYDGIVSLYTMKQNVEEQQKKVDQIYYHYQTHNDAFNLCLRNFDLKDQLKNISVPTLVTAGKKDWIIPPEYSKSIADNVQNSNFIVFENYGHSLVREQGTIYKKYLRDFIDGKLNEKVINENIA